MPEKLRVKCFNLTPLLIKSFCCFVLLFAGLLLASCVQHDSGGTPNITYLSFWKPFENQEIDQFFVDQVNLFNQTHDYVRLNLRFLPKEGYHEQLDKAAFSGKLPDIIQLYSSYIPYFAWQDNIIPINKMITDAITSDMFPDMMSLSRFRNKMYGLGFEKRVVVIYVNKLRLKNMLISIKRVKESLNSLDNFSNLILSLSSEAKQSKFIQINDRNNSDLIFNLLNSLFLRESSRDVRQETMRFLYKRLNSSVMQSNFSLIQLLKKQIHLVDDSDEDLFLMEEIPFAIDDLSDYRRYKAKFGDHLAVLPLPGNKGQRSTSVMSSWQLAISKNNQDSQAAMRFLEFIFSANSIRKNASFLSPTAISQSSLAGLSVAEHGFDINNMSQNSIQLSHTPAYPAERREINKLFDKVLLGLPVEDLVSQTVFKLDNHVKQYQGFK